jgi:hypothetical protein
MSKTFSEKTTKVSMSVFPRLFCFIAFSGGSQRWKFKKNLQKNPNPICFSFLGFGFVLSRFRAFLGEGSSKTREKISRKKLNSPGTFLTPEEPTNHAKARFFF